MAGIKRSARGRRRMAATVFLAIVLFMTLTRPFLFGRKTVRSAAIDAAAQVPPLEPQIAAINWKKPEPIPEKLKDPFDLHGRLDSLMIVPTRVETGRHAEAFVTTEMGPQFRISGIVYNQGQPLAIINSQLLHEGDSYSGFIITDIQRDSVEFMLNDQRWNLSMHKEDD